MLAGRTVLIVEAQYLIALDLQNSLDDKAPARTVIAQDPGHARHLANDWRDCALAIIEVERELSDNIALVRELLARGIAVIVLTADADLRQSLNWFADVPVLLKPVPTEAVTAAIAAVICSQKV